jgi:arsenate reductase (glutaredoxin)
MKITVYEKPTCTTCRNLSKLFLENGIGYDKVNYFIAPFTETKLRALLKKAGIRPYDALRKSEVAVKERGITGETADADVIKAMVEDPTIIQRPIVEFGDRAVLARPIEKALELLQKPARK